MCIQGSKSCRVLGKVIQRIVHRIIHIKIAIFGKAAQSNQLREPGQLITARLIMLFGYIGKQRVVGL